MSGQASRLDRLLGAGHYTQKARRARKEAREADWTAVYVVGFDGDECIKVGVAQDLEKRLANYRVHSWRPLRVLAVCYVKGKAQALAAERRLLERFKAFRMRGEWLRLEPGITIEGNRALCDLCRADGVEPLTPEEQAAEVMREQTERMGNLRLVVNNILAWKPGEVQ